MRWGRKGMSHNDRVVRTKGTYDGPFWVGDPMVAEKYENYDPTYTYNYPPDVARHLHFEEDEDDFEEAAEQKAAEEAEE
jgi:hypothetical protein